eukprot:7386715-Prymnesium_polylepis.1
MGRPHRARARPAGRGDEQTPRPTRRPSLRMRRRRQTQPATHREVLPTTRRAFCGRGWAMHAQLSGTCGLRCAARGEIGPLR